MSTRTYAHTRPGQSEETWQDLREHHEGTGALAECFAAFFGAGPWGYLAGLWHDLGKYHPEFQQYLRQLGPGIEHAITGAWHAMRLDPSALPLALVIAGHHAGLPNIVSDSKSGIRSLKLHLDQADDQGFVATALAQVPTDLLTKPLPKLPERLRISPGQKQFQKKRARRDLELWTRFLFSALVDADSLNTEAFGQGHTRQQIFGDFDSIPELRTRLDRYVDELAAGAQRSTLNATRAEILAACRRTATQQPGIFSLSVPTGGGKTLASMAFALRHAEEHTLRRVIIVAPFISIIDQNAAIYRKALGDDQVIEHHSNLDPKKSSRRHDLATENWDAPIIVTTAVQFFESLFANRRSRCRKLHNVVRSVIVIDEVQTLPKDFLAPILEVLGELRDHYGCTLVLSSATQPALLQREALPFGLTHVTEIIEDPKGLARRLDRFDVQWPDPAAPPLPWDTLAGELADHPRVLAIVHCRQDARDLARLLPKDGLYHLSTLMCAAHRLAVIERIKQALADPTRSPVRVVSTQLIEAGVDLDFPVVYRALGPLDSLIQAGGRCNREGGDERGRLIVFRAPTPPPPGNPKQGLAVVEALLAEKGGTLDLQDPELVERYFKRLYYGCNLDSKGIQAARGDLNFATVGRKFKLIEDHRRPIVVPYGEASTRLEELHRGRLSRKMLRALQPYLVQVSERDYKELQRDDALEEIHETVFALSISQNHLYDEYFGLTTPQPYEAQP